MSGVRQSPVGAGADLTERDLGRKRVSGSPSARISPRSSPIAGVNSMRGMVRATKVGIWSNRYHLDVDGVRVTTWDGATWRAGGTFALDGRQYRGGSNAWE